MIPLVTASTLQRVLRTREESAVAAAAEIAPAERADFGSFQLQLGAALSVIEHAPQGGALWAPDSEPACQLLSFLAEQAAARPGPSMLEAKFDDKDLRGWIGSFFHWWRRVRPHPFVEAQGAVPRELPDHARIALFGDWGVGDRYGAKALSHTIADRGHFPDPIHAIIHLGDTYYSGTEKEVEENLFYAWPKRREAKNFALNGNHEMYGGGKGYFKVIRRFGQHCSYFALQNSHFTVVGLDTAYTNHELHGGQVAWLQQILAQAGRRKVVFLSHHQPFSAFEPGGSKLTAQLEKVLTSGQIRSWYWGHEHRCVIYERHGGWGTYGRCIGHGGYPYFRVPPELKLKTAPGLAATTVHMPTQRGQNDSQWLAFPDSVNGPKGLVLADGNPYLGAEGERYGAHGFVMLELDGPRLIERFHRPDGTIVFQQELAQ